MHPAVRNILNDLWLTVRASPRPLSIVVVGGGGWLLREVIASEFRGVSDVRVLVADTPRQMVYANAMGMLRYLTKRVARNG